MSSKDQDIALSVQNVTKTFKLPHEKNKSLKGVFLSSFRRKSYEVQKAVTNVNFEVKKGEFFGIVGRNGSGKSTLLKMLAGVYIPDSGSIQINGKLIPFIELGVGFNPELSGRDNVFLNGALFGKTRKEMEALYQEIVEFAELERFMDQKLKNYSSGMQVRLAFSIAIRAQGDILLLDEVLAVGDTAFQKKCNDYFYELKNQKITVILVTHSMAAVEQFCDRAMLIDEGRVERIGDPVKIADLYNELNLRNSTRELEKQNKLSQVSSQNTQNRIASIERGETYDTKSKKSQDTFTYSEKVGIRYFIKINEAINSPNVGLVLRDKSNNLIFATNTKTQNIELKDMKKNERLIVEFEIDNTFTNSSYYISGAIASIDGAEVYHKLERMHEFEIGGWKMPHSLTHPNHRININYQ